jgi:peptidoglycan hydrolase-like protein with peptidoglycan-binding domain
MSATKQLIDGRVGEEGGQRNGPSVRQLQQLLLANGYDLGPNKDDASWGTKTKDALMDFQKRCQTTGIAQEGETPVPDATVKVQAFVDPGDRCLFCLARAAEILIPLPGKIGMSGVKIMHEWFVKKQIKYQEGAQSGRGTRATYGLHNDTNWAVQTTDHWFAKGPVQMDCTTYVNLMLGVFQRGDLHGSPYDASTPVGWVSTVHLARDRYLLPLVRRTEDKESVNFYQSAEQIKAVTKDANLYVLEVAGTVKNPKTGEKMYGAVTHMALLYNGETYECTNGQSGSACITRTLDDFMSTKAGRILYLFGPKAG